MLQTAFAAPIPSLLVILFQAVCHCLDSDPGFFMICGHHARFLAGKPSFRPACSGPNDRGSSGDSGGAVRSGRVTGRRITVRMEPGAAVWGNRQRFPSLTPERRLN